LATKSKYTDHRLAVSVPSTNLLATVTYIDLASRFATPFKGIHLLDQPFPPHRPLAHVSFDWILSTTLSRCVKACISPNCRQKTVSQDLVRDIALPPSHVSVPITRRHSCCDLCSCPRNPSHHHGIWFKPSPPNPCTSMNNT